MDYIFGNEIFSLLFIIILLLYYFAEKHIPILKNKIFTIVLILCFAFSIINTVNTAILQNGIDLPVMSKYAINSIIMSMQILIGGCFLIYTLSGLRVLTDKDVVPSILLLIPFFAVIVLLVLNPNNGFIYTFEDGKIINHIGYYVIYIIGVLYYLTALMFVISYFRKTSNSQRVATIGIVFTVFVFQLLQIFVFPNQYFSLPYSINSLLLILTIQNPNHDTSNAIVGFNNHAFNTYLHQQFKKKHHFSIIVLSIDNFADIDKTLGHNYSRLILNDIYSFLKTNYKRTLIFNFESKYLAIVHKNFQLTSSYLDEFSKNIPQSFGALDLNIIINRHIVGFNSLSLINHQDNLYQVINKVLIDVNKNVSSNYHLVTNTMTDSAERYIYISRAINKAIENNDIEVYYQPIVCCKTNQVHEYEALAKLYDSLLGYIPADEFITISEENGSIIKLGDIILEKVCMFINKLHSYDINDFKVAVNLSAAQCLQADLIKRIDQTLAKYNIDRKSIKFEITETYGVHDVDNFSNVLHKLREEGFELSLDDYGTGYSTIEYILNQPFSVVKIDKSLLKAISNNKMRNVKDFIANTIHAFQGLGLKVICEGVENIDEYNYVKDIGSDYYQGFYFSYPISEENVIKTELSKDKDL